MPWLRSIGAAMKGLICAGGTATRLEELTRVTNKHLLPVGGWPMVYYPLQLLQRVGVREVLLVTGKQHAGDFIDLLGDGRLRTRTGDEPLFDLDLTYKVQVEPGGIAQVVGMARDFAARREARRLPRRQHLRARAGRTRSRAWDDGALVFVKEVPDPENFGVVAYDDDGGVADIVEKAGVVDMRYARAAVERRRRRALLLPAGRVRDHRHARAVEPRRARDHRRQPRARPPRPACASSACEGWWHDGGKHWGDLADVGRLIEQTGVNK